MANTGNFILRKPAANPGFFKSPPFWKSEWNQVNAFLDGLKKGSVSEIGKSQGGRTIRAVSYGKREPVEHLHNISVSMHGEHPESFFDPRKRTRPVVVVISTIHGAEIEGCVSCLNLAQVMEEGKDLRGRKWDELRRLAEESRIVMVPLAQPDGRVRSAIHNFIGGSIEDIMYFGQGRPKSKKGEDTPQKWYSIGNPPASPDEAEFLGGYYNDAGINIDLDDFFSGNTAPETRALVNLVRDETPDMFIVLHSHNPGPWISSPNTLIPLNFQCRQAEIGALVAERHRREGLRPAWKPRRLNQEGYFSAVNLPTFLHYASGSLPLAFEFPHGLAGKPYTFDEILDIGLTLFEEILRFAATWRHACRN